MSILKIVRVLGIGAALAVIPVAAWAQSAPPAAPTAPRNLAVKDRYERCLAWYAKYLKGEETGRPAEMKAE